jgi:uncharacterized protein with HEPN domain
MKDQKIESRERLTHIREAIHQIEVFIQDISKAVFLEDQLVASAVLFQFSVIGEAIIHVDIDLLSSYNYPWHKVRAFRNLISHMYFQIKLDAVWEIIENDLPELKLIIETILKKEF